MAQTTGLYDTADLNGEKQSFDDLIYNISPTDTPLYQLAGRTRATAVYHQWQTDSLATATTNTGLIEGDEYVLTEPTATTEVGDHVQIFAKTYGVSETAQWIQKWGRGEELAYLRAKAAKEIKRDIETTLLANQASRAGTSTLSRRLGGLPTWLTTNLSKDSGGSGGGFSGTTTTVRTNGTARSFSNTLLNAAFQLAYGNGGNPTVALMGPQMKVEFSGFDGVAGQTKHEVADKTIYDTAEVYIGPFGRLSVMLDRFIRTRTSLDYDVFLLDPDYVKVAVGADFHFSKLAKIGHSEREALVTELTLEVCNEAAHGLVTDLN